MLELQEREPVIDAVQIPLALPPGELV